MCMKIIVFDEIRNFLILSFFFHLRSLRYSKNLIAGSDQRVFLTFHTCSLTPLEPNLTEVAWRAKEFRAVAPMRTQLL